MDFKTSPIRKSLLKPMIFYKLKLASSLQCYWALSFLTLNTLREVLFWATCIPHFPPESEGILNIQTKNENELEIKQKWLKYISQDTHTRKDVSPINIWISTEIQTKWHPLESTRWIQVKQLRKGHRQQTLKMVWY